MIQKSEILQSFSHGCIVSKLWLCNELEKHASIRSTIHIFGSWYGNMALMIYLRQKIAFDKIINYENRPIMLIESNHVLDALNFEQKLDIMPVDCNTVTLPANPTQLLINTSTENMQNAGWFQNIPSGTLVALQGRTSNFEPTEPNIIDFTSLSHFKTTFPLTTTLFEGETYFGYPDGRDYTRFMLIGYK